MPLTGDDPFVLRGEVRPVVLERVVHRLGRSRVDEQLVLRVKGALLDDRDVVYQDVLDLVDLHQVSWDATDTVSSEVGVPESDLREVDELLEEDRLVHLRAGVRLEQRGRLDDVLDAVVGEHLGLLGRGGDEDGAEVGGQG